MGFVGRFATILCFWAEINHGAIGFESFDQAIVSRFCFCCLLLSRFCYFFRYSVCCDNTIDIRVIKLAAVYWGYFVQVCTMF